MNIVCVFLGSLSLAGPRQAAKNAKMGHVRIAFGTDERTPVTDAMQRWLSDAGHEAVVVTQGDPWTHVGHAVGRAVATGAADRGVVCCWTGTGVSIAANKEPGVRAALCTDAETARGARRWNDANVLAIGLRLTSEVVATELLAAFLDTDVDHPERATIADVEPGSARGPAQSRGRFTSTS